MFCVVYTILSEAEYLNLPDTMVNGELNMFMYLSHFRKCGEVLDLELSWTTTDLFKINLIKGHTIWSSRGSRVCV